MYPLVIYSIVIGLSIIVMSALSYNREKMDSDTENSYAIFMLSLGFVYLFFGVLNFSTNSLDVIGKDWTSLCAFASISIMSFSLQRYKNLKNMNDDEVETKTLSAKSIRLINQIILGLSIASLIIYIISNIMAKGDYSHVLNGILFLAFLGELVFIYTRKDNSK